MARSLSVAPPLVAIVVTIAIGVAGLACPGTSPICTEEARSSLAVRVEDEAGTPIGDADVTAAHEGGAPQACEAQSNGDGSYVCPIFEIAGNFSVTASRDGFVADAANATVGADECHVIPEEVVLVLAVAESESCCCAFIRPGDIDIISEEPTATADECAARDQGSCIDPTGRFTPHPCCPDATGDRC